MRSGTQRVIIASGDATATEVTNQVEHLLGLLAADGRTVELALVGDGERLRALRARVPVFVADRFRTRGLGQVASLLGLTRLAGQYKSWRVRRWTARATDAVWIVVDARACSFLRHAPTAPRALVGAMLEPGADLRDLDADDRSVLADADLWLTATAQQAVEVSAAVDAPVHFVGDLYEPSRHHLRDDPRTPAVVLSARSHLWEEVSHAVEVVARLHALRPEVPIAWLADAGEDEWLVRHDLRHLDLPASAPVEVVVREGPIPVIRPLLLVRTSYAETDPDLAVAAAFDGVPTIGFALSDLPPVLGDPVPPFAVDVLVEQIIELLDDERRRRTGARLRAAIQDWHDIRRRLEPLEELLRSPGSGP